MALSKEDYDAYYLGREERAKGIGAIFEFGNTFTDMLFHSSAQHSYYKQGLDGEPLCEIKEEPESSSSSEEDGDSDGSNEEPESSGSYEEYGSYSSESSSSSSSSASSSSSSSSSDFSGLWAVLIGVAILIGIGSMGDIIKTFNSSSAGDYSLSARSGYFYPVRMAPEQIVDRGACPFEGCRYGEQWLARQDVDVYEAPPTTVGVAIDSFQKKTVICAGEWVTTETGIVLAKRHEGRAVERTNYGAVVVNGPPLRIG
ncbi:MAG: hypothetical protein Q8N81_06385, partial [bacterium]|nr:hypothetical protein [bacterium]